MFILTIRTDKPEAEIGLFDDSQQLDYKTWLAHRQLAETIHSTINELLQRSHKNLDSIEGILCFRGPGSFTGLRIGLTVGNSLAYGLDIPILTSTGDDWIKKGIDKLLNGQSEPIALPEYGAPVHITVQKK